MKKQYLETGRVVGTHGVRGEMRVQPWCDSPDFLTKFRSLYLDAAGETTLKIKGARVHGNIVLIKADGVDSIEDAEKLRGKTLYINRKDVKLEPGRYFIDDLIGCAVTDADSGESLGTLTDVSATGANDVWHIEKGGREYLVPAIPDVIVSVDIDAGAVVLRPLKGIFDDED